MNRLSYFTAAAALLVNHAVLAAGSLASVSVIDRDSGTTLPLHYFRGEYWVAGEPGARYAIEIRNRSGARVLAVTSVDGINVISGATAAWNQTGYVFAPGEQYQVTGWRKSNAEIAAFTFAQSPDSYAERTGRPANVGVIGVALFRERIPEPVRTPRIAPDSAAPSAAESARAEANTASAAASKAQSMADAAARATQSPGARAAAPAPRLGTGHGEREYSYVTDTEFERLQSEPNEIVRIRYDSLENLVAMGVIRRTPPRLPEPNAFPDSRHDQFVPDPPG